MCIINNPCKICISSPPSPDEKNLDTLLRSVDYYILIDSECSQENKRCCKYLRTYLK